ncbi:unnamed protein product, partial [Diplocarpon coronariae]
VTIISILRLTSLIHF